MDDLDEEWSRYVEDLFHKDIWITLDEQEIPITELTDTHLANCLEFCKRDNRVYGCGHLWVPKLEQEIIRRNKCP
jgi:hypothetical protein